MADEVTPGCEIVARLVNDVHLAEGRQTRYSAVDFLPDRICFAPEKALVHLCDHLHNTLNSGTSDSAKLAAIREYIEPVDPWLVAMREAFAYECEKSGWPDAAKNYRNGRSDKRLAVILAALRSKLCETA